jgi:DNA-binding transcriptional regulator YbjK
MFTEPIFITRALKDDLSDDERELAAILYELVASEAAFLNSMRTLDAHFVHNADFYDDDVLPPADRQVLFAGIEACMQISTIFPFSVCGVV